MLNNWTFSIPFTFRLPQVNCWIQWFTVVSYYWSKIWFVCMHRSMMEWSIYLVKSSFKIELIILFNLQRNTSIWTKNNAGKHWKSTKNFSIELIKFLFFLKSLRFVSILKMNYHRLISFSDVGRWTQRNSRSISSKTKTNKRMLSVNSLFFRHPAVFSML